MSRSKWKKKTLYIANFIEDNLDDYGNKITVYDKPIFIGLQNIQPLSGSTDIEEYGNRVSKIQKVLLDWKMFAKNNNMVKDINNIIILNLDNITIADLQNKYKYIDIPIKENDLAYLDGVNPIDEDINGDNANYRVDSVRWQNKKVAIYFEKLPNK